MRSHLPLVAATSALSLALCAPALASSTGHAARGAHLGRGGPGIPALRAVKNYPSNHFAGYGYQTGGYHKFSVMTAIVVPKLKCSSGPDRAIAAGVSVSPTQGITGAFVLIGCSDGKASYFPALAVNGSVHEYHKLKVRPGDKLLLRVTENAKQAAVSVVNETHHFKQSLKGAGSSQVDGPGVGDYGWYKPKLLGVPNFGKLHFSDSKLDGKPFGSALGSKTPPTPYKRVKGKQTQITTSAFSKNQESFVTNFVHS